MNKRLFLLGFFSVAAFAGGIACTTTTTTTEVPAGTTDGGTKEGGTSTKDSGTTTDDKDSSTNADPDEACGDEATLQGCATCCATNHQDGYATFTGALLGCACNGTGADGGTGPCATDCAATACASTPANPDATCNACLQASVGQAGACQQAVGSACTAEPDCLAQQKCVAQCQGKQ